MKPQMSLSSGKVTRERLRQSTAFGPPYFLSSCELVDVIQVTLPQCTSRTSLQLYLKMKFFSQILLRLNLDDLGLLSDR